MYNEAISNLNAYLSGEKEARTTYKYQTSNLEVDGQTIWADMKNSQTGEIERRPVFQMGYNAFGDGTPVNYFPDMGFNTLAIEVGINQLIVQPGGTHGWTSLNRKDNTCLLYTSDWQIYGSQKNIRFNGEKISTENIFVNMGSNVNGENIVKPQIIEFELDNNSKIRAVNNTCLLYTSRCV